VNKIFSGSPLQKKKGAAKNPDDGGADYSEDSPDNGGKNFTLFPTFLSCLA
jgi:hypothetical protein